MWPFFVFAGILAGGAAAALMNPLLKHGDRRAAAFIAALVLAPSLGLYFYLGRPGLAGQARTAEDIARAAAQNNVMLAQKPFETLARTDPNDIGALMSLGELSRRLKHYSDAVNFYNRALDVAREDNDPRTAQVAEALGLAYVEAAGGRMGEEARKAFEYLRTLDPQNATAKKFLEQE